MFPIARKQIDANTNTLPSRSKGGRQDVSSIQQSMIHIHILVAYLQLPI